MTIMFIIGTAKRAFAVSIGENIRAKQQISIVLKSLRSGKAVRQAETSFRFKELPPSRIRRQEVDQAALRRAMRTAFVARFIVLREGRRSRAHRLIEAMSWDDATTADDLYQRIRDAFVANGDKMQPVDRDLRRALDHARCSANYFVEQYLGRSCLSFQDALADYERSNRLLFGDSADAIPRSGGWRLPSDH